MWRLVEEAALLELVVNHFSTPSSIRVERPFLCPGQSNTSQVFAHRKNSNYIHV